METRLGPDVVWVLERDARGRLVRAGTRQGGAWSGLRLELEPEARVGHARAFPPEPVEETWRGGAVHPRSDLEGSLPVRPMPWQEWVDSRLRSAEEDAVTLALREAWLALGRGEPHQAERTLDAVRAFVRERDERWSTEMAPVFTELQGALDREE